MADFDAQLPVRAIATEFTTEVANATGTTINPAEDYAQGSTTSGQNGVLDQGAVTTANPTYVTGTTNPLSIDTSGRLRTLMHPANVTDTNVNIDSYGGTTTTLGQKTMAASMPVVIASDQSPINVQIDGVTPSVNYFTDSSVASGASVSHSVAQSGSFSKIDEIWASGSGEIKVNIAYGTTGSETDHIVGFTSAANKIFDWKATDAIPLTAGQSIKVTVKNFDNQAQDLYLTIIGH